MKKTQNDFPRKITFFKAIILKKIYTLPAISKRFKSWMMMPSISLMNAPSLYHWISGSGLASAQHSTRNEKKNKFGVILDQVLAVFFIKFNLPNQITKKITNHCVLYFLLSKTYVPNQSLIYDYVLQVGKTWIT